MAPPLTVLAGVGHMGCAMASGWLRAGIRGRLALVDPAPSARAREMASMAGVELNPRPEPAGRVILAIKPQIFDSARKTLAAWCDPGDTALVSIMAGIDAARLRDTLPVASAIRAMPNLPAAIGRGVTVWCQSGAGPGGNELAEELLAPFGAVIGPVPEAKMDAVTALSGCGPAYLFVLARAMRDTAVQLGLTPDMAAVLAEHTLQGAAAMLPQADAAMLADQVASPGGATEAALRVLDHDAVFDRLIAEAMTAARDRSAALSGR